MSRRCACWVVLSLVLGCAAEEQHRFSPEPYLADLRQLETFTAATYANLEWALTEGDVDPVALHEEVRRAILQATGDEQAREALVGFVEGFGDGHFRLLPARSGPSDSESAEVAALGSATPAAEACERLGYEEHDQSFRVDFGDGFQPVVSPDDPFPAGWLESGGRRAGIVRIDEFGANRFGEYCPETWEAYSQQLEGPCDDWPCEYGFRLAVVARLLDEIGERVGSLEEQGIDALVVDITRNGGGSDWVHPVARMLTGKRLLGSGRSVVRSAHWQGVLGEMAADVDADLARPDLGREQRALLEQVSVQLARAIADAGEPCDLSLVWTRGAGALPCSLLVRDRLYTTGLLPAPPEIETTGLISAQALFKALDYGPRPTVWRGPLAVLIDQRTASASELFAALLRDNDAATLIGQRTHGSGCGYTNGGIQEVLQHSRLEVWLPDCVRHRRGGGNERAGIEPDLEVVWVPALTAAERGDFFVAQIERWLDRL